MISEALSPNSHFRRSWQNGYLGDFQAWLPIGQNKSTPTLLPCGPILLGPSLSLTAFEIDCSSTPVLTGSTFGITAVLGMAPNVTRTALITGCSPGGIGHAMARKFQSSGYRVIATARTIDAIRDLEITGTIILPLEVTSEESIQACMSRVIELCPNGLDFLINNAGVAFTIPALDADLSDARRCFDTNFFAVLRLVQVSFPLLMRAGGTIVMVGSLASEMPYVFGSVYNASKAALLSFADTLRVELAPFNVSVITVMTGGVKSQLTKKIQRLIPEASIYAPINQHFERRKRHSAEVGVEVDAYVESVVKQLLPGAGPWPWRWFMKDARKKWIWAGGSSSLVWFMCAGWLWHNLFDWYFTKKFHLNQLNPLNHKSK